MQKTDLPSTAKLVAFNLGTYMNSKRDICWPGHKRIAAETSLSTSSVRKQLGILEEQGWIVITRKEKSIQTKGGTQATNIYQMTIPDELRRKHAIETIKEIDKGAPPESTPLELIDEGVPPGSAKGCHQEAPNHQLKPPIKDSNKSDTQKFTDQDMETARWIYRKLLQMNPGHKKPNGQSWAETIRKIRELDGKTDTEIRTLFAYANEDHFWKTNILSPNKLREKWDMLTIRMNEQKKGPAEAPSIYAPA